MFGCARGKIHGMSTREERAKLRRASWAAEVVLKGQPKGRLYDDFSSEQRLAALARLNQQVWGKAAVADLRDLPRSDWPGEVFEVTSRGRR